MLATTEQTTYCPYCGERISLVIDQSVGDQEYIEDCEVCCKPIVLHVMASEGSTPQLVARNENE